MDRDTFVAARRSGLLSMDDMGAFFGKTGQTVANLEANPSKLTLAQARTYYERAQGDYKDNLKREVEDFLFA